MCPFEADKMDTYNWIFQTKVEGHLLLIQGLLSTLRRDQGRVSLIGAPEVTLPNAVFYGMANWAINGFSRGLRTDLYGQGIPCSLIMVAGTKGNIVKDMKKTITKAR